MGEVAEGLSRGGADFAVGVAQQREEKAARARVVQLSHGVDGEVADARGLAWGEAFGAKGELVVAVFGMIEVGEDGEHFAFHVFAVLDEEEAIQSRERGGGSGVGEVADGGDPGGGIVLRGEEAALDAVWVHRRIGRWCGFDDIWRCGGRFRRGGFSCGRGFLCDRVRGYVRGEGFLGNGRAIFGAACEEESAGV